MNVVGIIVMGLIILSFVILGILFSMGKGAFLIAGYNTMSAEEKAKYDTDALCKFMGKMMFALAFSMLFWILSDVLNINWLFGVGLVLFFGIVLFLVIYANTGNRFKKE